MQTPVVVPLSRSATAATPDPNTNTTPTVGGAGSISAPATAVRTRESGVFLPLLLGLLALCAMAGSQCFYIWKDHEALLAGHAAQQAGVDNAVRMRAALDTLAVDTQRLADAGNAGVAALVAQLKQAGITINARAGNQVARAPGPGAAPGPEPLRTPSRR